MIQIVEVSVSWAQATRDCILFGHPNRREESLGDLIDVDQFMPLYSGVKRRRAILGGAIGKYRSFTRAEGKDGLVRRLYLKKRRQARKLRQLH